MSVSAIRAALLQEFDRNRDIGFRVRVRGTPTTQSQYVLRRFLHSLGPDILTAALSQIGVPYIWADEDPKGGGSAGFDCSGLVKWAYSQVGILLPHQSEQMRAVMTPCPVASVRPGDVLHYDFDQPGVSSHVALFLDGQSGGRVVDTESPQRPVAIRTFAQVVRPPFAASYNEYVTGKH
jgi:cell wall-associated NlpC family hydrolase